MNGYVTDSRLNHVIHLPISFAQTELRAGRSLPILCLTLSLGQVLEMRSLTANIIRVLTSGVLPEFQYTAYGVCNVGLYRGKADCTPLAYTIIDAAGSTSSNPFNRWIVNAPGDYRIIIKNNTTNLDISVVATGAVKLYF